MSYVDEFIHRRMNLNSLKSKSPTPRRPNQFYERVTPYLPAAANMGLTNLPVPYLYERAHDPSGLAFYINHATGHTSWCHPVKLAVLQDARLVAPSSCSAPFVDAPAMEDPAVAREARRPLVWKKMLVQPSGFERWLVDVKAAPRRHPDALRRGRRADSREMAPFRDLAGGVVEPVCGLVDGYKGPRVRLPLAEMYLSSGTLPPWVVRETVVREGELVHFYVDYRTDTYTTESPVDWYAKDKTVSAEEAVRLEGCEVGREMLGYYVRGSRAWEDKREFERLRARKDWWNVPDAVRNYCPDEAIHYL